MPGPMAACARSTGAMSPCMSVRRAPGSSDFMRWTKARWVVVGASLGRGRQARTIDEARALVPWESILFVSSLRTGHVAVTSQPAPMRPSSSVCQPVEVFPSLPLSCCL